MTKIRFMFQNSISHIDKTTGGHFEKKNPPGDYCVIITSGATNQSREFPFFTYVIMLITFLFIYRGLNDICVEFDPG